MLPSLVTSTEELQKPSGKAPGLWDNVREDRGPERVVRDFQGTGQAGGLSVSSTRAVACQRPCVTSHSEAQGPCLAPEALQLGPCPLAHFVTQTCIPLWVTFVTEQTHPGPQRAPDPIPHCTEGTQRGREHPATRRAWIRSDPLTRDSPPTGVRESRLDSKPYQKICVCSSH